MKVITIGKRLVPAEHVAFVEPFDPASNPEFKPDKDYKGRVVLLDRDMVLTEQTPQAFAAEHHLHLFTENCVAVNRTIQFKIETFEPTDSFKPTKPYQTRLKWRDLAGDEQSKLLVTAPETVIAEILQAKVEAPIEAKRPSRKPACERPQRIAAHGSVFAARSYQYSPDSPCRAISRGFSVLSPAIVQATPDHHLANVIQTGERIEPCGCTRLEIGQRQFNSSSKTAKFIACQMHELADSPES